MANPYVDAQAAGIQTQANNNLQQNVLPGINSGAVAAGGYGGSRQGIAQGLAIGQSQQGVANAQANLYSNAYNTDQANTTSRLGIGANYNLGLGGLGLQNQAQQNNFYTNNRQLDQSGAQLGANLYGLGTTGNLSQGAGQYGIGTTQQNAPWTPIQNASNVFNQYSGLGGSQIQTQNGSALGAVTGGALLGSQVLGNLGLGRMTTQPYQSLYGQTDQTGNGYGGYGNNIYGDGYGPS